MTGLGDVVGDGRQLAIAAQEDSFNTSFLRSVNRTSIEHQYSRVLAGLAPLTDYDFYYEKEASERYSGLKVEFKVQPNSKPASNIHILIGRNGVGKRHF